jgi:hypothetical protein
VRISSSIRVSLFLALAVGAARADVRWSADFANDDLKQWGVIQCGGQGGTCPCLAPFYSPQNQVNYGSGSCSSSNSNTPLSIAPANGRFQIVTPPPGQENTGKAMRIELRNGDLWPCASGCGSPTTRNEVVHSMDSGTSKPTFYRAGDDRYFAWSTYFPPEFARWTCMGTDSNCPNGVPNSNYNPWNVVTQFHQNGDSGVNPLGIDLRRTNLSSQNSYALVFLYGYNEGSSDRELWRQELQAGNWYDFVLHVRFSQGSDGVLELWVGNNGGTLARQTLACPGGASITCNVATLYSDGANYLKQGLYRNSSIADTSVIFHKGMRDGDTFADVTAVPPVSNDFSLSVSPASQTVAAGVSASYAIETAVSSGTAQTISLSATGLPPGVTGATFNPPTVLAGESSVLTLTTDPAGAGVSGAFTVSGRYPGGTPAHSANASISITPPPGALPPVATLIDSFGGTAIDATKWTVAVAVNATATEGGGTLNLAPRGRTDNARVSVESNARYSLAGSVASVQVPQVVSGRCGVNNRFLLRADPANSLGFWFECGNLYAFTFVNGVESLLRTLAYSSIAHKWWRIRESSGVVVWETSPDKVTWTAAANASVSALFPIGSLTVTFDSYTYGGGLRSPGVGRYAHLNE